MEGQHGYPVCTRYICRCCVQLVNYISKGQKGMSERLREACAKARKENSTIRRQARDIGSKFVKI